MRRNWVCFTMTLVCIISIVASDTLYPVDEATDKAIRDFVNDGSANIVVTTVYRNNNSKLLEAYMNKRNQVQREATNDISSFNISEPKTVARLPPILSSNVNKSLNEFYLFHGTKVSTMKLIAESGFNISFSSPANHYGSGVYTAELIGKAAQYPINVTEKAIIIGRVLMGKSYHCQEKNFSHTCLREKNNHPNGSVLSVVFDCGECPGSYEDTLREFAVFENERFYPDFAIVYHNKVAPKVTNGLYVAVMSVLTLHISRNHIQSSGFLV
ncbi:poly [ADP-ribose] polymerase 14 [Biomphalaria glabrata]|nr:poly [ADP-ribose] polymerase 14 [Biomphalaria glabrata]